MAHPSINAPWSCAGIALHHEEQLIPLGHEWGMLV